MINKYTILLISYFLLFGNRVNAQFENSGIIHNSGGIIDNYPVWTNTGQGTYTGLNFGVFEHFGPAGQTFINHGIYQTSLGHKDVFKGPGGIPGVQEIGGTKRPYFFDLDLVNGSNSIINVSNTEGISVSGNLNFSNGITKTLRNLHQAASIRFGQGATYINANSDVQHVNGYITKIGNTPFIFPVGSGTDLRFIEINAPENETAELSTAWIEGNPDETGDPSDGNSYHPVSSVKAPIVSVSKTGQWDWIPVTAPSNQLTIKVSIPDVSGFSSADKLRLVGWDGEAWMDLSGGQNASGNSENNILTGVITVGSSISAVAIGTIGVPLPVRLLSFNAAVFEKNKTELTWKTASELNNDYFGIEHSNEAKNFLSVGQVQGKGTSAISSDYSFIHKPDFPHGIHYYRLKQVDLDGSFAYSTIRSLDFGEVETKVFPNPASHSIVVEVADWNNLKSMELVDELGHSVYQSENNRSTHSIDIANLASGNYIVRMTFLDGSILNKKILIVK